MHRSLKLPKMKLATTITTRIFSGETLRQLSTGAAVAAAKNPVGQQSEIKKEFLFQKLYELGTNGGRVSDVLHRNMRSGKQISKSTLVACLKDLRKFGRYQQCSEILDWMEKGRYDYSGRDYALRIQILCKLKGLSEVEKYFESIPSDMKDHYAYGSLLYCYCNELATDKALPTFKKMDELGYASNILAFNSLLYLFVKGNQPEKVSDLVADMKQINVPLNAHTYSFWIQSYRHLGDLEGVERVFHESQQQPFVKDDWVIYSNVASVFIEFNQIEKAILCLEKLESLLDCSDKPNRIAYHHLLSLYGNAGKLESVIQAWNNMKSKFKVQTKLSYLSLFQALLKLDDIKGLEKYFQEWESTCKNYDDRLPAILIRGYLKHDMLKEAELVLKEETKKAGKLLRMPHVQFMNYYFEKHELEFALKHMEIALDAKWKPFAEKLDPCFQHFKTEKNVDGMEKFCRLLKKAQPLDAKAYLWLLQTYVDAEKTAPDMRERIAEDGIHISPEIDELLDRVCPSQF